MIEYDMAAARRNVTRRRAGNPNFIDRELALACLESARRMLDGSDEHDALMMVRDAIWALGGDSFPED